MKIDRRDLGRPLLLEGMIGLVPRPKARGRPSPACRTAWPATLDPSAHTRPPAHAFSSGPLPTRPAPEALANHGSIQCVRATRRVRPGADLRGGRWSTTRPEAGLRRRTRPSPKTYWKVDDVRPGMKGDGRTVMVGTKLEEFGAEVLGVMQDVSPGRDMVLCRLTGLTSSTPGSSRA